MTDNYDSFIDYMFEATMPLMFIGGVLMLLQFGWWYVLYYVIMKYGKKFVRHKSRGLCLALAAFTAVFTQFGAVLHEYFGKWVYALFLATLMILYVSFIFVLKKLRPNVFQD